MEHVRLVGGEFVTGNQLEPVHSCTVLTVDCQQPPAPALKAQVTIGKEFSLVTSATGKRTWEPASQVPV
jgi:hypothetical protein